MQITLVAPSVSTAGRWRINARRLARWQGAVPVPGKAQQLMLLIGEVKEIVPSLASSYERMCHDAGVPSFMLGLRDAPQRCR